EAITRANATPGTDTIRFALSGSGVHTIALTSALPTIDDPVVIDGTSQPGYSDSPLVAVDGTGTPANTNGFLVTAGSSTIRGLTIGNFATGMGVYLQGDGGNTIDHNWIGTDTAGTAAAPTVVGVFLGTTTGTGNTIRNNVLSGSSYGAHSSPNSAGH